MTTPHAINSNSRSPLRLGFLLIPLALVWLAISPTARAVTPAPDGGYPNGNTAEGDDALFSLATGATANTAIGFNALYFDTFGEFNTAIGYYALFNNTGEFNTASGVQALFFNTNGANNTATGAYALFYNTNGSANTANGVDALQANATGSGNTATGFEALVRNITGNNNTATGWLALVSNSTGSGNTAIGQYALQRNTTGSSNIVLGVNAGLNLTTGSGNIDLGNVGVAGESGIIRIGSSGDQTATFIAGIRGTPIAVGVAVGITADGQLGVRASSARFKSEIKPMDKASEAILALKPVTFHYKKDLDPKGIPQFGLVAEDVAKVAPDLVACDADGKPFTVRYDEVNAMLLNEFIKEHRKVEEQTATISEVKSAAANRDEKITRLESTIAEQQKQIASLTESLKQQAAEVRKVGALLETQQSTPRLVLGR